VAMTRKRAPRAPGVLLASDFSRTSSSIAANASAACACTSQGKLAVAAVTPHTPICGRQRRQPRRRDDPRNSAAGVLQPGNFAAAKRW